MFITGAEGPNAHKVIGKYMATGDVQNGYPLYQKVGNKDRWLYVASNGCWNAYNTASKEASKTNGDARCMELNLFDPTHGKWEVYDGSKWVEQGSLVVSHDLSQVCAALPPCVPVSDHA